MTIGLTDLTVYTLNTVLIREDNVLYGTTDGSKRYINWEYVLAHFRNTCGSVTELHWCTASRETKCKTQTDSCSSTEGFRNNFTCTVYIHFQLFYRCWRNKTVGCAAAAVMLLQMYCITPEVDLCTLCLIISENQCMASRDKTRLQFVLNH